MWVGLYITGSVCCKVIFPQVNILTDVNEVTVFIIFQIRAISSSKNNILFTVYIIQYYSPSHNVNKQADVFPFLIFLTQHLIQLVLSTLSAFGVVTRTLVKGDQNAFRTKSQPSRFERSEPISECTLRPVTHVPETGTINPVHARLLVPFFHSKCVGKNISGTKNTVDVTLAREKIKEWITVHIMLQCKKNCVCLTP